MADHNDPNAVNSIFSDFAYQVAKKSVLFRDGQLDEACDWIDRGLASRAVEPHLFCRAAEIYAGAGNIDSGRNYRERATRLNLSINKFHVHH